ncbi:MAG: hypothetical protein ACJ8KU_06690 [Chthoniobacterales bacterium]
MADMQEYLCGAHPEWGRIAILPGDTEIFGFAVADLQVDDPGAIFQGRAAFAQALRRWADQNSVELVGCGVPAGESRWRALLPRLDFRYVETALSFTIPRVQGLQFDQKHARVRLATEADRAAVELIAERGFNAGRYHADPLFPRELANRRYCRFIGEAFADLSDGNRVYVTGGRGSVTCFMHTRLRGDTADVVLGGTDPSVQGTIVPLTVWLGALMDLKQSGVRRLKSRLSAGNTAMMNIAAHSGARFSAAQHVFHWHAEGAAHLHGLNTLWSPA